MEQYIHTHVKVNFRLIFLITSLFAPSLSKAQSSDVLNRFSFEAAFTFSINQYGISPFSSTRPASRGIPSILLNLQYSQPLTSKFSTTIGLQLIERGLKLDYSLSAPGTFYQHSQYERRLSYLELPVCLSYQANKYRFFMGLSTGYLYKDDFRYKETTEKYINGQLVRINTFEFATSEPEETYKKWDLGVLGGISRNIYKGLDIEFAAQKQVINPNLRYLNSKDITYLLTLSLGIRYRFL